MRYDELLGYRWRRATRCGEARGGTRGGDDAGAANVAASEGRDSGGGKAAGKEILVDLLDDHPRSEVGWLWMSALVDDVQLERECLELELHSSDQGCQHLAPVTQQGKVRLVRPDGKRAVWNFLVLVLALA